MAWYDQDASFINKDKSGATGLTLTLFSNSREAAAIFHLFENTYGIRYYLILGRDFNKVIW